MSPKRNCEVRTLLSEKEMARYEELLASFGGKKGPFTRLLILRELGMTKPSRDRRQGDSVEAEAPLPSPGSRPNLPQTQPDPEES